MARTTTIVEFAGITMQMMMTMIMIMIQITQIVDAAEVQQINILLEDI